LIQDEIYRYQEKEVLQFTGEQCIPRGYFTAQHIGVDYLVERASRCYECSALALVAFPECFEQRDALGSSDELSEVVWT
jgi:hypothetical protein